MTLISTRDWLSARECIIILEVGSIETCFILYATIEYTMCIISCLPLGPGNKTIKTRSIGRTPYFII